MALYPALPAVPVVQGLYGMDTPRIARLFQPLQLLWLLAMLSASLAASRAPLVHACSTRACAWTTCLACQTGLTRVRVQEEAGLETLAEEDTVVGPQSPRCLSQPG